jgi:hypothetical protein
MSDGSQFDCVKKQRTNLLSSFICPHAAPAILLLACFRARCKASRAARQPHEIPARRPPERLIACIVSGSRETNGHGYCRNSDRQRQRRARNQLHDDRAPAFPSPCVPVRVRKTNSLDRGCRHEAQPLLRITLAAASQECARYRHRSGGTLANPLAIYGNFVILINTVLNAVTRYLALIRRLPSASGANPSSRGLAVPPRA